MDEKYQTVPVAQDGKKPQIHGSDGDPVEVLIREFSQEAGKRVGRALAEEIHNDPEVRRAAATGAGVGIGVVVGLGLLALYSQ